MSTPRRSRHGFTLIELITVLAVLLLLGGMLYLATPQYPGLVRGNCMSQMKSLVQAVKMYRDDFGCCPEALYGYSADGVTLQLCLYPRYVTDRELFTCGPRPVQKREPPELVWAINPMTGQGVWRPAFSSYDCAAVCAGLAELRYTRRWFPPHAGDPLEEFRQLWHPEPADSSVVTWCLNHTRHGNQSAPVALVAFWDGRVQKLPAERLSTWPGADGRHPWQVEPKP